MKEKELNRKEKFYSEYCSGCGLPNITTQRVCIFVGAHVEMDDKLERAISEFCKKYNGIVLCDHTSNYRGEYRAFCNIVANQYYWKSTIQNVEL